MPSHSPDHGLNILLLGGFDVRLNGRPAAGISYNKMRALLAYLAVEREQDHNREVLAELLWSGTDSTTARGNLRRTLSDLRRALELPSGIALFSVDKHTIRFIPNVPNVYVDTIDFTRQTPTSPGSPCIAHYEEKIVALYRGEFMEGLSFSNSPDFEDWLLTQREALHRRALRLLEQLSNYYLQIGDYSKALQFDLRYLELEPWDEEAHRRTMLLYALNGQNSAAIHQYEACCHNLKKELGALPSEKTRHLVERIRNGELRRAASPNTLKAPPLQTMPPSPAERRQVTVLYCELILAAIDDPDEAMELLCTPQTLCVEIIRQFSGHIVQTYGGGLLAYFGYPQAHEDAARRAVQAALAVTREAAQDIEIRAAVHTGLIITGGEPSMPDTLGKTSKLAIQLRHSATHNEVAISRQTYNIVAGYFDCISLGAKPLPGFAQAPEIFKVVRESGARSRLDAATQLTPLVGRRTEITRLMALWEEAAQGLRHVVLVQGEAGIGKSRLLHTLKERLAKKQHTIRELRCFPEFSQSPFYPLIAMLEVIFGCMHDDTPELKFGKLVRYLQTHHPDSAQAAAPLLAQLLSLPLGRHYPAPGLPPQKQKEQTIAILLRLLQASAAQQAVLLIVEDLHWVDPSTLELLTLFVEQTKKAAILAVFTARPDFTPPWKENLSSTLALAPLIGNEVAKMIASINEDIPAVTICRIVERADGVPLFAEEMAKIATQDNQASIPVTLHDLLAARMDSMGEAKYTAQLAATLGREFDLDLLRKISPYGFATLTHSLSALQDAGLILKVNETTCQFKHALIQEAAYQSQTKADRQAAHQRVAQALLSDFPDVVATQPELLAQHLSAGGETRQSIEYRIKAGQRAARNSANTEAIEHFNSSLQGLMTLSPGKERDRLEFELRINLGTALIAAKGYGSAEAEQAYTRALELRECMDDNSGLFKALWGIWLTSSSRIDHTHSVELAEILLDLAEQNNDELQLQLAHHAMGNSSFMTGNPNAARMHFERSMALYLPSHHEMMVDQFGENVCVSSGSLLSCVLWLLGFQQQADEVSQRALALARQVNHPHSLGYALCAAAIVNRWMKRLETTGLLGQEAIALSYKHGFPFWLGLGSVSYGWTLSMQGQAAGIVQTQQCLDAVNTIMSGAMILFLAPLCEALVHLRQFDKALEQVNEALNVINAKDARFFESEFYRLKGICLLEISKTSTEEAEACFREAFAISRRQGAKSLELRAAICMARLWRQQNKQEEARHMLAETYNGFTEGFDTPDLQEASELLAALG